MLTLYIEGKKAVLQAGKEISITRANPFLEKQGDYSLDIELPLRGCPQNIAIPALFACMNAKKQFNNFISDIYYQKHTNGCGKASDCLECGKCEKGCPQHLPIRSLLKDVAKEFEHV